MNTYDTVPAYSVEDGDQIIINGDPLEDVIVFDEGATEIVITGVSNNTGDRETYKVSPDALVDLWAV